MAKLGDETLDQGRSFVSAMDLPNLMGWLHTYAPTMDRELFERTMRQCFAAGDWTRAVRLFNAAFTDYDPAKELMWILLRAGVKVMVFVGVLGGCLYLLRSCI